jgi:predicted permease
MTGPSKPARPDALALEDYAAELRRQLARVLRIPSNHAGVDRIVDEFRAHVEDALAEQREAGRTSTLAMPAVLSALGPPRLVAEAYRSAGAPQFAAPPRQRWGWLVWLRDQRITLMGEVTLAWRSLRHAPGYTAAFVLTLALGIGANAAIFSVVRGIWLRPLPHRAGERLVYLRHSARGVGIDNILFSVPEIQDIRSRVSSFEGVAELSAMVFVVQGLDQPRQVAAGVVTANYFAVMGLSATCGRLIGSGDDGEKSAAVAVLTDAFWKQVFAADPGVVGRVLRMNDRSVEIVGVLEPAPPYPEHTDIFVNTVASPHHLGATMTQDRTHRMTEVFARLAPGRSVEESALQVAEVSRQLHAEYPEAYGSAEDYSVTVTPLREQLASRAAKTLLLLFVVTGLILLIACANVANLTLARILRRQDELAVRVSLGAGAWRIRRQLLIESLIPSLTGAVLGCAIAYGSVDLLEAFAGRYSARASEIGVDGVVLTVALLIGVLAAGVFAILPPVPGSLGGAVGTRGSVGRSGRRAQRALVVYQVASCCVLLVAAGLFLRTLSKLRADDGGFDLENVLTVEMPPPLGPKQSAELMRYFSAVLERARSLPGVTGAAFARAVPLRTAPQGPLSGLAEMEFEIEGAVRPSAEPWSRGDYRPVSPEYFETVGLTLLRGRLFDERDDAESRRVVVVNQSFAEGCFGSRNPIGRRVAWRGSAVEFGGVDDAWREIVGVVSDSNDYGVTAAPPRVVFQPLAQETWAGTLLVRTDKPGADVVSLVSIIRELAPEQPIVRVATLAEVYEEEIGPQRLNAALVSSFALLALVISAVGVGGVLAFGVTQRTRELGVRAALGADRRHLLLMVVAEGGLLTSLGLALGAVGGVVSARFLGGLLFGVVAADLPTLAGVAVVMMAVALAASLWPARQASRVDPIQALRAE